MYEYECPKCKTVFAEMRPVSKAGAPAKCPKDQKKARRIYGAAVMVGRVDTWSPGNDDGGGFDGSDEFGGAEVGGMDEFGGMGNRQGHGPGGHMH